MTIKQNYGPQHIDPIIRFPESDRTARTALTADPCTDRGSYAKTPSPVLAQKVSSAWRGAGGSTTETDITELSCAYSFQYQELKHDVSPTTKAFTADDDEQVPVLLFSNVHHSPMLSVAMPNKALTTAPSYSVRSSQNATAVNATTAGFGGSTGDPELQTSKTVSVIAALSTTSFCQQERLEPVVSPIVDSAAAQDDEQADQVLFIYLMSPTPLLGSTVPCRASATLSAYSARPFESATSICASVSSFNDSAEDSRLQALGHEDRLTTSDESGSSGDDKSIFAFDPLPADGSSHSVRVSSDVPVALDRPEPAPSSDVPKDFQGGAALEITSDVVDSAESTRFGHEDRLTTSDESGSSGDDKSTCAFDPLPADGSSHSVGVSSDVPVALDRPEPPPFSDVPKDFQSGAALEITSDVVDSAESTRFDGRLELFLSCDNLNSSLWMHRVRQWLEKYSPAVSDGTADVKVHTSDPSVKNVILSIVQGSQGYPSISCESASGSDKWCRIVFDEQRTDDCLLSVGLCSAARLALSTPLSSCTLVIPKAAFGSPCISDFSGTITSGLKQVTFKKQKCVHNKELPADKNPLSVAYGARVARDAKLPSCAVAERNLTLDYASEINGYTFCEWVLKTCGGRLELFNSHDDFNSNLWMYLVRQWLETYSPTVSDGTAMVKVHTSDPSVQNVIAPLFQGSQGYPSISTIFPLIETSTPTKLISYVQEVKDIRLFRRFFRRYFDDYCESASGSDKWCRNLFDEQRTDDSVLAVGLCSDARVALCTPLSSCTLVVPKAAVGTAFTSDFQGTITSGLKQDAFKKQRCVHNKELPAYKNLLLIAAFDGARVACDAKLPSCSFAEQSLTVDSASQINGYMFCEWAPQASDIRRRKNIVTPLFHLCHEIDYSCTRFFSSVRRSGTTSVLSVDDMGPPANCEPTLKNYAGQEFQYYFNSRFSDNSDRNVTDIASPADCLFNSSSQPGDACDPPCFSDGILDSSSPIEKVSYEDDSGSDLKVAGKDIFNTGDIKSAMKRLSLHSSLDFSMVPASVLIYTLHSSDLVSEQDYVRNLMALAPEEREALMKSEAERLRTYGSGFWPIRDVMPPEELAAAGFYYTGVHDRVQCAFCRGVLRNWERGDSAMNEHRVHFSYCRLVMGLDCGNLPIASRRPNGENASAVPTRGGQANLFASTNSPLNDVPDNTSYANVLAHGNDFLATMGSGEPLPGVSTAKPKHPEHAVEARRLQSFSTWPLWALQSPENLAKAGFYYAGFGDNVKCFYCDGGLRNWEIMDNPWEEHARWFKECKYLLDVKGQGYVDEIQKKYAVGNEAARLEVTSAAAASKTSPGSSLEHPSVQLVKSLGYNESQILAALDCYFPEHQTGTMPKGAELLDAVLRMEDEASGAHPALIPAGRSMPTSGRVLANEAATPLYAMAASRPSETASMPSRVDRQRPEPDGISGPNVPVNSSRAVPDVKRQQEPPPSERPLASLHDIIFTGLLDLPDGETRFREENRQMHKHLECKGCRQRPAEVVLLPCGHFSSCLECVPSLRNCPVCVTVVRGTIRTYLC